MKRAMVDLKLDQLVKDHIEVKTLYRNIDYNPIMVRKAFEHQYEHIKPIEERSNKGKFDYVNCRMNQLLEVIIQYYR